MINRASGLAANDYKDGLVPLFELANQHSQRAGFTLTEVMISVALVAFVVGFLMIRKQELVKDARLIKEKREVSLIAFKQLHDIEYSYFVEGNSDFHQLLQSTEGLEDYTTDIDDQETVTIEIEDPLLEEIQTRELTLVRYSITSASDKTYEFILYLPVKDEE